MFGSTNAFGIQQHPSLKGSMCLQEQPPGMHMIHLPFADDIRRPERDFGFVGPTQIFADEPAIEAATAMIGALSHPDYQVGTVPNPALQRFFEVHASFLDSFLAATF